MDGEGLAKLPNIPPLIWSKSLCTIVQIAFYEIRMDFLYMLQPSYKLLSTGLPRTWARMS